MLCSLCTLFCWAIGLVVFILILGWWMNGYFRRRGVKSPPAYLPFLGHMGDSVLQKIHFMDFVHKLYKEIPGEKYIGILQFMRPIVVLKDVDLIKQITIKDFDHFLDHASNIDEDADLIFGNSLFSLKGQKWRDMRATLSPAFTSSKMRGMFQFVVECGEQMTNYYMKQLDATENKVRGLVEVEMKDAFTRYANDVIASTAFGLQVNSFTEKDNLFYLKGKEATSFSGFQLLSFFFMIFLPRVAKFFKVRFFSLKLTNFYKNLVWDTVNEREKQNIVRNDMIQLLMEARKGTLRHDTTKTDDKDAGFATVEESAVGRRIVKREWSDNDLVAQAVLFFVAGFDTASTLLCFMVHELSLNPTIQKRLQDEIDEVSASVDGKITYDCLQKMKYMDMVVSETLRKWPPSVMTDRKCIKSYTLPPPNKESTTEFQLNEDDGIWIPIYGIHHDPKYFKYPEVFDPERFSDENKDNIQPFTFIPFGVGPRNCIGSRFALMETKAIIFNLLLNFDVVTTAKTQNPIKLKLSTFNLHAENGFWCGLKPRTSH